MDDNDEWISEVPFEGGFRERLAARQTLRTKIAAAHAAGVREEREACAKIAEGSFPFDIDVWVQSTKKEMTALLGEAIAAAIRARANTGGENDAALQERESK